MQFQDPSPLLLTLWDHFIMLEKYEEFTKRIQASEKIFRTNLDQLKQRKAISLYMQGNPQLWDQLQEEKEAKNKKEREQIRTKKEQIIVNNLKKATEQQKNNQEKQPSRPTTTSNKPATKQLITDHTYITNTEEKSPNVEARRNAKEHYARQEKKQAAKESKNHNAHQEEGKEKSTLSPTINIESLPQEQASFHTQPQVAKLYTNLYSLQPKLTDEDVVKLLAGFGLKIDSKAGKGSHTKCTFVAGEVVTDNNKKVIFTCPNLQSFMTIIPQWDSKDIPSYMIKNLRYILEKIGVTEKSIVLQKDK